MDIKCFSQNGTDNLKKRRKYQDGELQNEKLF